MSLKASCFAVKQQFYGHFLATRIFHLATEKKFQSPLGARIKKLISDPVLGDTLWAAVDEFVRFISDLNTVYISKKQDTDYLFKNDMYTGSIAEIYKKKHDIGQLKRLVNIHTACQYKKKQMQITPIN